MSDTIIEVYTITSEPTFVYVPLIDPKFKRYQKVVLTSFDGTGARRKGIVVGRSKIDEYVSYTIRLLEFEFIKVKEQKIWTSK
jgi:hypothetical protein